MKLYTTGVIACCLFCLGAAMRAADAVDSKATPSPAEIQDIIKKFTQKETEFSAARESYTYRQTEQVK